MESKTIGSYGGPYVNDKAVRNPQSQIDADFANSLFEDVAQCTRTANRSVVRFQLQTSGTTVDPANVAHVSAWGSSSDKKPAVERMGAGVYRLTWATSYDNDLVPPVAETVNFFDGDVSLRTAQGTWADGNVISIASNVVLVQIFNSTFANGDIGGAAYATVWMR